MSRRIILTQSKLVLSALVPATIAMPLSLVAAFDNSISTVEREIAAPSVVSIELPRIERRALTASSQTRDITIVAQLKSDRDKDDDQTGRTPAAATPGGFKPGTAEHAIYNFCVALSEDNTATASDYVSPGAKGLLGQMRDGELGEDKIEELVNFMTPVTDLEPAKRGQTMTKRILDNKKGQVMTFLLKKDKDQEVYRITEISITKSKMSK